MDMKTFARTACPTISLPAGQILFRQGDAPDCMYIIQQGEIEILAGEAVVDTCRANDAIGFMSVIDGGERTLTAKTKVDTELSVVDKKKFHFMIDEVPNFAFYIMEQMAKRIRGLGHAN